MKTSFGFIGALALTFSASLTAMAETATLDAGEISVDDENGLISASGIVEARAQGRVLSTKALTYDREKAQLTVPGPMSLTESNGDKISAANAIIDNELEKGRFNDMRLATKSSGRMKAASAARDGAMLELEDAIYTSCPECDNPNDAPLWQIKASRISYDRARQDVTYQHPRLELYGVPVFYLPFMAHAGPEVEKRSGFLTPSLANSSDFGSAVDIPYFFNLAPNHDLTLTQRISDQQDPFVKGEWRHLTRNGSYQLTAYMHRPQDELADDSDRELRAGIVGDGRFLLGDWTLGFAIENASDDLFFRRYKISNASRLTSNLSAQRRIGNHFISLESFHFRETLTDERASTVGAILPAFTHQYDFSNQVLGGTLAVINSLTHRLRKLDVDETKLSSTLNWSWRHVTSGGFIISANNILTLDAYNFVIDDGDASAQNLSSIDDVLSANSASITLGYPLQRVAKNDRQILSPKLQFVLADANDDHRTIPHIGAATRQLSKSQLFQPLAPKDEASRINIGLDHELNFRDRLKTHFFIG